MQRFLLADEAQREAGITAATGSLRDGELVVFPTDTVYGLAADAFSATAVAKLLAAKGRGREMPPPVLIPDLSTLNAITTDVPLWVDALSKHFWPGALTLVLPAQPSLQWDLGETAGSVAVRIPNDPIALELLQRTGPLAVSSANLTAHPAATDADQAQAMLAPEIAVLLDGGERTAQVPSTILDCRGEAPVALRAGAISAAEIAEFLRGWEVTLVDA